MATEIIRSYPVVSSPRGLKGYFTMINRDISSVLETRSSGTFAPGNVPRLFRFARNLDSSHITLAVDAQPSPVCSLAVANGSCIDRH